MSVQGLDAVKDWSTYSYALQHLPQQATRNASLISRSASIALLDKICAEERDCLLACVLSAETQLQLKTAAVQSMGEITFKIQQGQEDLTVVHYDSPLSVAQAKQALLEENTSWIGALQEEGSSRRVGGDQQLKPGSSYILTLQ
jgi:hypothetical protein